MHPFNPHGQIRANALQRQARSVEASRKGGAQSGLRQLRNSAADIPVDDRPPPRTIMIFQADMICGAACPGPNGGGSGSSGSGPQGLPAPFSNGAARYTWQEVLIVGLNCVQFLDAGGTAEDCPACEMNGNCDVPDQSIVQAWTPPNLDSLYFWYSNPSGQRGGSGQSGPSNVERILKCVQMIRIGSTGSAGGSSPGSGGLGSGGGGA